MMCRPLLLVQSWPLGVFHLACMGLFKMLMPLQTLKIRWFHIKMGLPSLP